MHASSYGIALKLGATLAFSLMYVAIRLAGDVPVGEVIFFRAFFSFIPLFAVAAFTIGPRAVFRTNRLSVHIIRAIAGVIAMFFNFAALQRLPLADLTAFSFVMPIFAVVLAALVLHEQVGPWRGSAVVIGFGGVLLMLQPHGSGTLFASGLSTGAGLALMAALLSAFVVVFIRQMSATEQSETIVFYFMTITATAGLVTMIWWRVPLTLAMTAWLILSGILGGVGQICMTFSYRFSEPSLLAPFDYVAMVWAATLGFLVFGEVPSVQVIAGAAVVVAAGLFIAWRERRLHKAAAEPVAP
jgi:drug/metabolite transporter (DMT)-like permease